MLGAIGEVDPGLAFIAFLLQGVPHAIGRPLVRAYAWTTLIGQLSELVGGRKPSFRDALRQGARGFWRVLLIRLISWVPIAVLVVASLLPTAVPAVQYVRQNGALPGEVPDSGLWVFVALGALCCVATPWRR